MEREQEQVWPSPSQTYRWQGWIVKKSDDTAAGLAVSLREPVLPVFDLQSLTDEIQDHVAGFFTRVFEGDQLLHGFFG